MCDLIGPLVPNSSDGPWLTNFAKIAFKLSKKTLAMALPTKRKKTLTKPLASLFDRLERASVN